MALTADVALVTTSEIEKISGEVGLDRLDEGSATIANAAVEATNWLIQWVRGVRSFDPSKLSNSSELKQAAAHHAAYMRLDAQPGDEYAARAARQKARRDELLAIFVCVSTDTGDEQTVAPKGLPRTLHRDRAPLFGSRDNLKPGDDYPTSGYWQK